MGMSSVQGEGVGVVFVASRSVISEISAVRMFSFTFERLWVSVGSEESLGVNSGVEKCGEGLSTWSVVLETLDNAKVGVEGRKKSGPGCSVREAMSMTQMLGVLVYIEVVVSMYGEVVVIRF
jgi:hypothetical protein